MCTLPSIIRIPLCRSTVSHNNAPSEVAATTLSHLQRRSDAVTRRSGAESFQDFRLLARLTEEACRARPAAPWLKVPRAWARYFDGLLYCTMRSQTMGGVGQLGIESFTTALMSGRSLFVHRGEPGFRR